MDRFPTSLELIKYKKGFSLIELLIAVAISAIIVIVVIAVINLVLTRSKGGFESFEAQKEAVGIMNRIAKETRQAAEVVDAQAQSFTFREYLDVADIAPYQIRFFLDGETLKRGQIPPSGAGPTYTYNPADETIKILSLDVINGADSIFTYYDQDGNELSAPVTLAAVTMVEINLTFQQLSNSNPLRVSTKAQLRFNKNNL
ncbi:MAG TPA: prepilin-type N-terminal cleavage/methylation domain-containing protein [Candidatus Nanoarchaeia archaeon]